MTAMTVDQALAFADEWKNRADSLGLQRDHTSDPMFVLAAELRRLRAVPAGMDAAVEIVARRLASDVCDPDDWGMSIDGVRMKAWEVMRGKAEGLITADLPPGDAVTARDIHVLNEVRGLLQAAPSLQGRQYVDLGIQFNALIERLSRMTARPAPAEQPAQGVPAGLAEKWRQIASDTWPGFANDASNAIKAAANAYIHCARDLESTLAASPAPAAVATVEPTRCDCHPETCCCGGYTLRLNGEAVVSGNRDQLDVIASAVNRANGQSSAPAPAAEDGYREAFYRIADLMDIPAMAMSPKQAFETVMLPRLKAAFERPDSGGFASELTPPRAVPVGWKLVPIKATEDMCYAMRLGRMVSGNLGAAQDWENMVAAAPEAP